MYSGSEQRQLREEIERGGGEGKGYWCAETGARLLAEPHRWRRSHKPTADR
jgi:hypothetical protein